MNENENMENLNNGGENVNNNPEFLNNSLDSNSVSNGFDISTNNVNDSVNTSANVVTNGVNENIDNVNSASSELNSTVNQNTNMQYEEVEIRKMPQAIRTDSYFDGKLLELIGWNLLRFLITMVTLGIAGPWGEVMLMRYQIEHTVLNGKRLKFEGSGGSLFVEKFKWFFFTLITLGIYGLWIPVKKYKWILANVYFEDEQSIKGESFFDGKMIQLVGVNILCYLLNVFSFGLLYAFTQCFRLKWLSKHTIINRKRIVFDGKAINLFGKYILWCFLSIITFGIYSLWLGINLSKWEAKNTHIKAVNEVEAQDNSIIFLIGALVILFVLGILVVSFIASIDVETIKNNEFLESIFGPTGVIENITSGGSNASVVDPGIYDVGSVQTAR